MRAFTSATFRGSAPTVRALNYFHASIVRLRLPDAYNRLARRDLSLVG